ncbi:High-affinity K+ transport system, ATPase chain B [hydrothermal vent metagenome]|uniref:High-affinity K+ transport system, ATPase chain B n=1 Tax=hydrothermal vent metagenome TaxID=652676 RepID=A0A3B0SRH9_9ZZZZ
MKFLLRFIIIAAALWAGYWFVGASGSKAGFEAWFEQQRSRGMTAEYSDFAVQGFPNRFDAGFSDIFLADPRSGMAWKAPFFQILALSYKPNHLIAVWPDSQTLTTPDDIFEITSEDMRASLKLEPNTRLGLKGAVMTVDRLVVAPTRQAIEPTSVEKMTLAVEHVADTPTSYRLGLAAAGITPAAALVTQIDPERTLPKQVSEISADIAVRFDRPWDRKALEGALPQPRHIEITKVEARWGRLRLNASGALEIDASGIATGEIRIKARNWRDIIALAVSAGALTEGAAGPVEKALGLMAQSADDPEAVDIPLRFEQGFVFLGPVSLGPVPALILR